MTKRATRNSPKRQGRQTSSPPAEEGFEATRFTRTTSVRFTDEQWRALERVSRKTSLPVGTIIRVECLRNIGWDQAQDEAPTTMEKIRELLESADGQRLLAEALKKALRA